MALAVLLVLALAGAQSAAAQHEWTGAGDGTYWSDPANWSTGAVPGEGDTAAISQNGSAVVVDAAVSVANLTFNAGSGTLRLESGLTITDDFVQSSSTTLDGPADLAVIDTLFWSGGTMSGSGTTRVSNVLQMSGSSAKTLAARLLVIVEGGLFDYESGYRFYGQDGAVLAVGPGAAVDIRTSNNYRTFWNGGVGAAPRIENDGTIIKSGGTTSQVQIGWDIVNRGTIAVAHEGAEVQITGTLQDDGGTYSASIGRLDFTAIGGDFTAGSVIESSPTGTIDFSGGTTTILGTYDVQGATEVSGSGGTGADVTLAAGANVLSIGGSFAKVHDRGSFRLETTEMIALDSLSLGFGATLGFGGPVTINGGFFQENNTSTLSIANDMIVEGPMTWEGGTITGGGALVATGGLTITGNAGSASNSKTLDGTTLVIASGTTARQIGTYSVSGANGASLEIGESAVLEIDSWADWSGGPAQITVNGALRKTGGDSATRIQWDVLNFGAIASYNDVLELEGAVVDENGSYEAGPGGELRFDHPDTTTTFGAGSRFYGEGTMHFGPGFEATIGGTYEMKGVTRMSSNGTSTRSDVTLPATMTSLVSLGRILDLGNDLGGSGGILRVETPDPLTVDTLLIAGVGELYLTPDITVTEFFRMGNRNALLTGTGNVLSQGPFEFAGGTFRSNFGESTTVRAEGGVRFLGGAGSASWTKRLDGTHLVLAAGTNSTYEGTRSLEAGNNGTIEIEEGATLDVQSWADFVRFTGSDFPGYLVNAGTLVKSGGDSDTRVQLELENLGTVEVTNDVLDFQAPIVETNGTYLIGEASELRFSYRGEATFGAGSSISGPGTVHFGPGFIGQVVGTYDVSGVTRMSSNGTSLQSDVTMPDSMTALVNLGHTIDLGNDLGGSGGILRIETPDALSVGTLQIAGVGQLHLTPDLTVTTEMLLGNRNALLTGTGNVLVQGPLNFGGGTIQGPFGSPQTVRVEGGVRFYGSAGSASWTKILNSARLVLASGSASIYEGTRNLEAGNGAVLEIEPEASLDVQSWADFVVFTGSDLPPRLLNTGTFKKSGGDSDTRVYFDAVNQGTVEVTNDRLAFHGTFNNDGTLQGTAAIDVTSTSTLSHTGITAPGAPSVADPDTLIYLGSFDNANATVDVTLDDPVSDLLAVSGAATLGGTLNVSLASGFDPPSGATFTVLTAETVSGTFDVENLPTTPSGSPLQVQYNPSNVVVSVGEAAAAQLSWTGNGDGTSWSDPQNWSPQIVPRAIDNVEIWHEPSSPDTIAAPGDISIASLHMASALARLEMDGTFTVTGDVVVNNGLVQGRGLLSIGQDLQLGGLSSAGIVGSMDVDVAGHFYWRGDGRLSGSGEVTVHSGASITGERDDRRVLRGRTLTLHGASLFDIEWGAFDLASGSVLNIQPDAELEFATRADVHPADDYPEVMPVINNQGRIYRSDPGTGNTFDQVYLGSNVYNGFGTSYDHRVIINNTGVIEAEQGFMSVYFAEGSSAGGTYRTNPGTLVRLYRGEEEPTGLMEISGTLEGAGSILSDGPFHFTGRVDVPGILTLVGPDVFDASLEIASLGELFVNAGGEKTFQFDTPGSYEIGRLTLGRVALTPDLTIGELLDFGTRDSTALITGPGSVTVLDTLRWGGGTIGGSGDMVVNGLLQTVSEEYYEGDYRYMRPFRRTLARPLTFNGTAEYRDGTLILENGADLAIGPDAYFELIGDGNVQAGEMPGSIRNTGTFIKSGIGKSEYRVNWDGTPMANTDSVSFGSTIQVPFENDGEVAIDAGRLQIAGAFMNRSVIAGSDTLDLRNPAAAFTNEGSVAPGGADVDGFTILGGYAHGSGTLEIDLMGSESETENPEYDQVTVRGTATLGGTLRVTTLANYNPVDGAEFVVLTADTVSGRFANVVLPEFAAPKEMTVEYGETDVRLRVVGSTFEPALAVTPEALDFGTVPVDSTESLMLTVSNPGTAHLIVEDFSFSENSGAFAVASDTFSVAPGGSRDVDVRFTPAEEVSYSDTLVLATTAGEATVPLAGDGGIPSAAPIASNDTVETEEDVPVLIAPLENDTDANRDALVIASFTEAANGAVTQDGDSLLVYAPAENFAGADTLSYVVTDGMLTDTAEIFITVAPVNDAPVAADDEAEAIGSVPVAIDVLANDSDVEGDALSVESVQSPSEQGGTVEIGPENSVTYMAAGGFSGTDTFTYTAADVEGATDEATVSVTVQPGVPVQFTVESIEAPHLPSRASAVNDDGVIVGSYLDANGDIRAFRLNDGPAEPVTIPGAISAQAYDIDADGRIVGYAGRGDTTGYAFVIRPDDTVLDLGTFGGTFSSAYAVGGAGSVVGTASTGAGEFRAFLWQEGTLSELDLEVAYSAAYGVDAAGTAVGVTEIGPDARPHAFIGTELLGEGSRAYDINDAGQVVGSLEQNGAIIPYLWDAETARPLPRPEGGFSEAYAINDAGWAVGAAAPASVAVPGTMSKSGNDAANLSGPPRKDGASGFGDDGAAPSMAKQSSRFPYEGRWLRRTGAAKAAGTSGANSTTATAAKSNANSAALDLYAVLWIDGELYDLNELIDPESGWTLIEARDINAAGEIVGYGEVEGDIRAFRLRPTDNRRPVTVMDEAETLPGVPLEINVLANDTDDDGDELSLRSASGAINGELTLGSKGQTVIYTPGPDFRGEDAFSYVVADGRGGTAIGRVQVAVRTPEELPDAPVLTQNYPNPFNPTTVIEFVLPTSMHVDLRVFNALGQEVAVLINGPQEEGRTSVSFDATGLPVGTYFYRLRAGEMVKTRTLTLVK